MHDRYRLLPLLRGIKLHFIQFGILNNELLAEIAAEAGWTEYHILKLLLIDQTLLPLRQLVRKLKQILVQNALLLAHVGVHELAVEADFAEFEQFDILM